MSEFEVKICCWCDEPIEAGQAYVKDCDGDFLHFSCHCEEEEGSTFDRDMGFGDS